MHGPANPKVIVRLDEVLSRDTLSLTAIEPGFLAVSSSSASALHVAVAVAVVDCTAVIIDLVSVAVLQQ
jgi:hypothetical protein